MASDNDQLKQKEMKLFYDTSTYYEDVKNNFAFVKNSSKEYLKNNIFSIYYPQKEEKIIDIGCGWGNNSLTLQKKDFNVVGLDYSQKSIDICKKTALRLGLDETKFVCKDATNTGFQDKSFDVVYCVDLVEHLYPSIYNDLLKEVYRLLKKGGKFIIYTPNPSHFFEFLKRHNIILKKDISHVDYKTMFRLKETLIDQGFIIKKAYYIESHILFLNILEKIFKNIVPIFRRRNAVLAIKK